MAPSFCDSPVLIAFVALFVLVSGPLVLQWNTSSWFLDHGQVSPGACFPAQHGQFSWKSLAASDKLVWQDCYSEHQCARLSVPLNYSEPDGEKGSIAMVRIPSKVSTDDPLYRGPVLINPGGPGGSGVNFVVGSGKLLSTILGPQFDILGFDPRGVGQSLPRVSFFETDAERELWGVGDLHVVDASTDGVAREWARSKITNQLAAERQSEVLGHINTDHTARDMLRITEAHGKEKILYWGFSYGSVLGTTFAAMFPDKVERLVIDGVVDVENYFETLWSNNLIDTDKTMQSFFDECVAAGPEGCPFHAPTAEDISRNLTSLYDMVRMNPVPVRTSTSYGLVDYNRLKMTVFTSLYRPYAAFLPLAQGLAGLARGDGQPLFELVETSPLQCSCDESSEEKIVLDAQAAILCNDGVDISPSLEAFQEYFKNMTDASSWGEVWSVIRAKCIGWPKIPKNHYQGPFVGNTSFPLLFVGNTADPVTPLWAAKKTAKGYPGSVVLTQDSPGHCSIAAPSLCTMKHIRHYFVEGTLPEAGTICSTESPPFPKGSPSSKGSSQAVFSDNLTPDDRELLAAAQALSSSKRLSIHL